MGNQILLIFCPLKITVLFFLPLSSVDIYSTVMTIILTQLKKCIYYLLILAQSLTSIPHFLACLLTFALSCQKIKSSSLSCVKFPTAARRNCHPHLGPVAPKADIV